MPDIKIECLDAYSITSRHAFCAMWQDATHRYHVWVSIRPDVDGQTPPYPVRIEDSIYVNPLVGYSHRTTTRNLNAKANAAIKKAIKAAATESVLRAMFAENRAAIEASNAMHAEAWRLNAIHNALATLRDAAPSDVAAVTLRHMDIADALQVVLDLAKRNALDAVSNPDMADEAHRQKEAIRVVEDMAVNQFGETA